MHGSCGGSDASTVIDELIRLADEQGASQAAMIQTAHIVVDDSLADLCRRPACKVYGQAAGCPPHVGGPPEFRSLLAQFERAIVFKIDVPTATLLSDARLPVYRRLHRIAAAIEQAAVERGFPAARAFAGGSCKQIFCSDLPHCPVVAETRSCRHPDCARPSMSGYGIDVGRLMAAAGWRMDRITRQTSPEAVPVGALVGLGLIG